MHKMINIISSQNFPALTELWSRLYTYLSKLSAVLFRVIFNAEAAVHRVADTRPSNNRIEPIDAAITLYAFNSDNYMHNKSRIHISAFI